MGLTSHVSPLISFKLVLSFRYTQSIRCVTAAFQWLPSRLASPIVLLLMSETCCRRRSNRPIAQDPTLLHKVLRHPHTGLPNQRPAMQARSRRPRTRRSSPNSSPVLLAIALRRPRLQAGTELSRPPLHLPGRAV